MTLLERYENGEYFKKYAIVFLRLEETWCLVGPGIKFVGEEYDTFEQAMRRVDELYFEKTEAEYAEMDCS